MSRRHARRSADTGSPGTPRPSRGEPAPHRIWGHDHDQEALRQMERAVRLPVSLMGALMPDAHVGYGLPIGGVLATENAVIPYAVGMDIACRMRLSVVDLPVSYLDGSRDKLRRAYPATAKESKSL